MHDDDYEYCGDGGRLLDIIKEMLAENQAIFNANGNDHSDYILGGSAALRELAVELGIATYEELL